MSTSSVRRLKERGGAGGKLGVQATSAAGAKNSKSLTPLSGKSGVGGYSAGGESLRRSAGKENPRPTSRVRAATASSMLHQKPTLRAMPRIDKSTASSVDGGDSRAEPRGRLSTSSVPRGRSSSPSEFSKNLSDLRKAPRVSGEHKKMIASEKSETEKSIELFVKCDVKSERTDKFASKGSKYRDNKDNDVAVSSAFKRSHSDSSKMQPSLDSDLKNRALDEVKVKSCIERSVNSGELGSKDLRLLSKSSSLREKCVKEEGKSGVGLNKYPSKLHEKLAFLEGKVKRIASDIKRTKEMLDTNNPDASKLILSDIQEKISGIEKAVGNVEEDGKMVVTRSQNDERKVDGLEKMEENKEVDGKGFGNGFISEELEARLFPHHKLLRDRTSLIASGSTSKGLQVKDVEMINELKDKEKPTSPIDENPIALEFLASLNKEQPKATTEVENVDLQMTDVQDVDDVVNPAAHDSSLNVFNGKDNLEIMLTSDEKLDEFDDQENMPTLIMEDDDMEDNSMFQLKEIGHKTSTCGWFVSEGESVLLAHDDGSCSFYDIIHCEVCNLFP